MARAALIVTVSMLLFAGVVRSLDAADAKPQKKQAAKKAAQVELPIGKGFKELDADKNDFLSMFEVYGVTPPKDHPARNAFRKADVDNNDWLAPQEFVLLQRMGFVSDGKQGGAPKKQAGGKKAGGKKGHGKKGGKKHR